MGMARFAKHRLIIQQCVTPLEFVKKMVEGNPKTMFDGAL
jgi:hypothetical protein